MRVSAAVLAGGVSRRMGRTKALIEVDGVPMARRVADAATAGGCGDVVLVGGDRRILEPLGLVIVDDLHAGDGPVGGIVTALTAAGRAVDAVVVLACDLPFLDGATVRLLIDTARNAPDADVVVARTDRLEPGCALWRRSALAAIGDRFDTGTRAVHEVIDSLCAVVVDVDPAALVNVNRPDQLPEDDARTQ